MSQPNEAFASPRVLSSKQGPNSKDVLLLHKVSYNEEKKEILVEFANSHARFVERFKFFPFIALPKSIDAEKTKQLLLDLNLKKFSISVKDSFVMVQAPSVEGLKDIAHGLARCFNRLPIVLEPERQFLLEKQWSYFDSFMYFNGSLIKVDSFKKDVAFAIMPEMPFSEAVRLDSEQASFLVEQAALSAILTVPLHKVPRTMQDQEERFLENLFFKNGGFISWETSASPVPQKQHTPYVFDKVSSIDFSPVWAQLFSKKFFNIGTETKNCTCCKPFTLEDKNLLPSSLIEVIITEDAFLYESSSPTFAKEFDELHEGKEVRVQKKKEFFLTTTPVGPFAKGSKVRVPLLDAKKLLVAEEATLGKEHAPEWFCTEQESFFSREISKLSDVLAELAKVVDDAQETLFLSSDVGELFAQEQFKHTNMLIAELPFQLLNRSSNFYSPSLAKTIMSVQEATLFQFREFSKEKGYRVLHSDKRSTLIRGHSPLSLAKKFSQELALPQPEVASFSVRPTF